MQPVPGGWGQRMPSHNAHQIAGTPDSLVGEILHEWRTVVSLVPQNAWSASSARPHANNVDTDQRGARQLLCNQISLYVPRVGSAVRAGSKEKKTNDPFRLPRGIYGSFDTNQAEYQKNEGWNLCPHCIENPIFTTAEIARNFAHVQELLACNSGRMKRNSALRAEWRLGIC